MKSKYEIVKGDFPWKRMVPELEAGAVRESRRESNVSPDLFTLPLGP